MFIIQYISYGTVHIWAALVHNKYIYTTFLTYVIGQKVWIKSGHNLHILFPRVATHSTPGMPGWYKLDGQ